MPPPFCLRVRLAGVRRCSGNPLPRIVCGDDLRIFAGHRASHGPARKRMDRIEREKRVVGRMIGLYCRAHHGSGGALCPECSELLAYALRRLDGCRFGGAKPPCERCRIHCYAPAYRARIRAVMRYAGPRMLLFSPLDALWHLLRRMKRRP